MMIDMGDGDAMPNQRISYIRVTLFSSINHQTGSIHHTSSGVGRQGIGLQPFTNR